MACVALLPLRLDGAVKQIKEVEYLACFVCPKKIMKYLSYAALLPYCNVRNTSFFCFCFSESTLVTSGFKLYRSLPHERFFQSNVIRLFQENQR